MLDITTLKRLIEESTSTMQVCVPDRDYYARPHDWSHSEITFICPHTLIRKLEEELEGSGSNFS